jgi:hypothetical protein
MKNKNKVIKINNQKNYSNLVKVEEKIVHFNKWWDNKWQVEQEKKSVRKKLMQISIRNYKNNKQLKLNKSFNHKQVHTQLVWYQQLKIAFLNKIKNKILSWINNQKKKSTVVPIGEKENFMMIMMINNFTQSKMH